MSKVVKKVVKRVKKDFTRVAKFVKKRWKMIAIAAAIVFTAGAFAIVGTGATWGTAFTSIGTTFSAGAASLTGGVIGTTAASAAGSGSLGAVALGNAASGALGAQGLAAVGAAGSAGTLTSAQLVAGVQASAAAGGSSSVIAGGSVFGGNVAGAGAVANGGAVGGLGAGGGLGGTTKGITIGKAMMVNAGLQTFSAYQQGKAQDKIEKERQRRYDNRSYYGQTRLGETDPNATPPTISAVTPYSPNRQEQAVTPSNELAQPSLPQFSQGAPSQAPQVPNAPTAGGSFALPDITNMDQLANHQYGRV